MNYLNKIPNFVKLHYKLYVFSKSLLKCDENVLIFRKIENNYESDKFVSIIIKENSVNLNNLFSLEKETNLELLKENEELSFFFPNVKTTYDDKIVGGIFKISIFEKFNTYQIPQFKNVKSQFSYFSRSMTPFQRYFLEITFLVLINKMKIDDKDNKIYNFIFNKNEEQITLNDILSLEDYIKMEEYNFINSIEGISLSKKIIKNKGLMNIRLFIHINSNNIDNHTVKNFLYKIFNCNSLSIFYQSYKNKS